MHTGLKSKSHTIVLPQCVKEGNRLILVLNCLLRLSKTEILIWLQSTYVKLGNFV